MDIKSIIVTVLSLNVVNNYVVSKVMGVPNAFVKDEKKIARFGLYTLCVIAVAGLIGVFAYNTLTDLGYSYIALPVNALVSGIVAVCLAKLFKTDKTEVLLTVFNAAVIGTVSVVTSQGIAFNETYLYTISAGISYLIGMYLYAGVKSKIDNKAIPSNFKGLPIEIVALGIVALAVLAFK